MSGVHRQELDLRISYAAVENGVGWLVGWSKACLT